MNDDLTIVCVTEGGRHAPGFVQPMRVAALDLGARFLLAADCDPRPGWMPRDTIRVRSDGYIESVLDDVLEHVPDGYVLRLDDDELMSEGMRRWVKDGGYRSADHWAFPRLHLWPDEHSYIANPPLYPDLQTRLSVRAKAGGRRTVHVGSPYGTGEIAPCAIEHHKFLVRSREERERLVERYEQITPGAGREFAMFSVPELYADDLVCEPR